jgi:hypothetical protein
MAEEDGTEHAYACRGGMLEAASNLIVVLLEPSVAQGEVNAVVSHAHGFCSHCRKRKK